MQGALGEHSRSNVCDWLMISCDDAKEMMPKFQQENPCLL